MAASFCMKATKSLFLPLIGIMLIIRSIQGYSTGADCSLRVDHVDANQIPIPAQTGVSPFTVRVLSEDRVYRENHAVKVIIDLPDGGQFRGFVLQAIETATSTTVGRWESSPEDGTKTISCSSENDTITHSSNTIVTSRLELQWTPTQDDEQVVFRGSILQEFNVFWEDVTSQPISFDSRPVFYVNQTTLTLTEGGNTGYVDLCVNRPTEQVSVDLTLIGVTAKTTDITHVNLNVNLPVETRSLCFPFGLNANDDKEPEGTEVLLLSISNVGGEATIDDTAATVEVFITDNDLGTIAINGSNLQVSEADGRALIDVCSSIVVSEDTSVEFSVERFGDPTIAVTQDLTYVSPITIPTGQKCTPITISIRQDSLVEGTEVFLVQLESSTPMRDVSTTLFVLRVTDSVPAAIDINIITDSLSLSENIGLAQVQVCASREVDEDITVAFDITRIPSATSPASDDITFTSPLTIPSDTMCSFIDISIVPDNFVEDTETFLLSLTSAQPTGVLRQSSVIITVVDSEEPTTPASSISITREISVREDAGQASFQVCAMPPPTRSITIGIQDETINSLGGGISVDDMVTIAANEACAQRDIVIRDDTIPETDEQYAIAIVFVPFPNNVSRDIRLVVNVVDNDGIITPCSQSPCDNGGTCVPEDNQMFACLCTNGFLGPTCSEEEMFLPVSISPPVLQVLEGHNFTLTICYPGVQTTTIVSLSTNLETAEEEDFAGNFPSTVQVDSTQECTSLSGNVVVDNEFEGDETFSVAILSVSTDSSMRLDERLTTTTVTISDKDTRCFLEMPCQNGGQCIDEADGGFSCICVIGWIGDTCAIGNPCMPDNPCQNTGVCSAMLFGDGAEYTCMCTPMWTGANCESATVCLPDPCQNGATCEAVQDGDDYQCINCPGTHEGKNCDIFLPCSSDPCRNGGTCTNLANLDFMCSCQDSYVGKDCSFENPCQPDPCVNGECTTLDDGHFQCICPSGFLGRHCEISDFCIPTCQNGGTCTSSQGDPRCLCLPGFTGSICEEYLACYSEPCFNGGTCENQSDGSFKCQCRDGFLGDRCNIKIIDLPVCSTQPCMNGGTCMETPDGFICNCPRGWTGQMCDSRQTCDPNEDICRNGGTCWRTLQGVTCACRSGFTGTMCETSRPNIGDEEEDLCTPNPCENGGRCITADDENIVVCTCISNLFIGARCQDCLCRNGGTCVIDRCVCPQGTMGEFCETFEACLNTNCNNGGTCIVENNMPMCNCQDGFLGDTCEIVDDLCRDVTCFNGGTCRPADGSCQCLSTFRGNDCSVVQQSQTGSSQALRGSMFFCLLIFITRKLMYA